MRESVPTNEFDLIMKSLFFIKKKKSRSLLRGVHFGGSFRFILHAHLS